jgi:hypothetical protein
MSNGNGNDTASELERLVRHLWASTEGSLTNALLAEASGWPRADVEHAMRLLLRRGVVDLDVDLNGEVCWKLPGERGAAPLAVAQRSAEAAQLSIPGTGTSVKLALDPNRKAVLLSGGMGRSAGSTRAIGERRPWPSSSTLPSGWRFRVSSWALSSGSSTPRAGCSRCSTPGDTTARTCALACSFRRPASEAWSSHSTAPGLIDSRA